MWKAAATTGLGGEKAEVVSLRSKLGNVKDVKEDVLFLQLSRLIFSLRAFALAVISPYGR